MIDDLFNLIINKSNEIPEEFYEYLKKIDMLYTKEIIEISELSKCQMIKDIIFVLYDIYKSRCSYLLAFFKRSDLINIYNLCKDEEDKNKVNNFIAYYKKSLLNKYANKVE